MVRTEIKNYKPIFRKHQLYLDLLGVPLAKQILLDSNKTFGENLKVPILDDGIDLNHPDLEVDETLSNEYNNNNLDMTDTHGTAVAGIIGSKGNKYTEGIAPNVSLISVNILGSSGVWSDPLKYRSDIVDIYNNSWAISTTPFSSTSLINNIIYGATNGRNGKGSIYVFASGNDHGEGDEANLLSHLNIDPTIVVGQ